MTEGETLLDTVSEIMSAWSKPAAIGPFVAVPTLSMYPSNGVVQVYIARSGRLFEVSDGGGAVSTFTAAGGPDRIAKDHLPEIAGRAGLAINDAGWIVMRIDSADALTSAIALVAEASRSAAATLLRMWTPVCEAEPHQI